MRFKLVLLHREAYVSRCPLRVTVIMALSLLITISAITSPESVSNPNPIHINSGRISNHL